MLLFNHNTQGHHTWVFLGFKKFAAVFFLLCAYPSPATVEAHSGVGAICTLL